MVGEVKGIEMMGVLIAGRGARERGGRRLEVKVLFDTKLKEQGLEESIQH